MFEEYHLQKIKEVTAEISHACVSKNGTVVVVTKDKRILLTNLPDSPQIEADLTAVLKEQPYGLKIQQLCQVIDISTSETTAFLLIVGAYIAVFTIESKGQVCSALAEIQVVDLSSHFGVESPEAVFRVVNHSGNMLCLSICDLHQQSLYLSCLKINHLSPISLSLSHKRQLVFGLANAQPITTLRIMQRLNYSTVAGPDGLMLHSRLSLPPELDHFFLVYPPTSHDSGSQPMHALYSGNFPSFPSRRVLKEVFSKGVKQDSRALLVYQTPVGITIVEIMLSDPAVVLRSHSHSGINVVSVIRPPNFFPSQLSKLLLQTHQMHFNSDSVVLLPSPTHQKAETLNWTALPSHLQHIYVQDQHKMYVICKHEIHALRVVPKQQIYRKFIGSTSTASSLEAMTLQLLI